MTRFLLVGAGRIGKIHAENIVRSGRGSLVYVTDSNPAAAAELAATWNAGVAALDNPPMDDVDAVLIASSTDTHADWIERSASAGKGHAVGGAAIRRGRGTRVASRPVGSSSSSR
jgi:myo-inositol 2-dehydrogenase/D-chiro-inositol 1-dehydrogenase